MSYPINGARGADSAANVVRSSANVDKARALVEGARTNGRLDTNKVARDISELAKTDPAAAKQVRAEAERRMTSTEAGEFRRAAPSNDNAAKPAAAGPDPKELALDLTQMGLDIVGLVDPTPVSDGANTVISLFRGDFVGAGLSAVSMIPYAGDLAKAGKLGKWGTTVASAVEMAAKNPEAAKLLKPGLDKLKDAFGKIPFDKLPDNVRKPLEEMKAKLDKLGRSAEKKADDTSGAGERAAVVTAKGAPLPPKMDKAKFDKLPEISGPGSHAKPKGDAWSSAPKFENWTKAGGKIVANKDGSYTLIRKDLTQVKYSKEGYPDFRPFMSHPSGVKQVEIQQTGKRGTDFKLANEKAGHPEWGKESPDNYTWHHHENGTTMQLVERSVHNGTANLPKFSHAGGVSAVKGGN